MRAAIGVLAMIIWATPAQPACAADGIDLAFTLERSSPEGEHTGTTRFTSTYRMGFGKPVIVDYKYTTQLHFTPTPIEGGVHLHVLLQDFVDGSVVTIGEGDVDAPFGRHAQLEWKAEHGRKYKLDLSPMPVALRD